MKTHFKLLLAILLFFVTANTTFASVPASNKAKRVKSVKLRGGDSLYYLFAYQYTDLHNGTYDVVVSYVLVDQTTGRFGPASTTHTESIAVTNGPSFSFPSGASSFDYGAVPTASLPWGSNVSATISPNSQGGNVIQQTLMYSGNLVNL